MIHIPLDSQPKTEIVCYAENEYTDLFNSHVSRDQADMITADLAAKIYMRLSLSYYYSVGIPFDSVVKYMVKPEWKNIELVNKK